MSTRTSARRGDERLLQEGLAHHRAGAVEAAAACYRAVLARAPKHVDALHLLGIAERDLGNLAQAARLLGRVVELRPAFAEALGNLGMVLAESGQSVAAASTLRRALELNDKLVEPWFTLGNLRRDQGELREALVCYEQALARRTFVEAWRNYANLLLQVARVEDAIGAFQQALVLNPDDAGLHDTLGVALQRAGRIDEAIASHFRATRLKPDFAGAFNNLGNALKDYGKPAEAIAAYRAALAQEPALAQGWNNLGTCCLQLGAVDQARVAFQQALTLAPDFAEAHLNLGNVLKLAGHLRDAEFCYRRALRECPELAQAHNNLGVTLCELGNSTDAETALHRALELAPDFAEAYNNLGTLYKNQGRLDEALDAFATALRLRPDYVAAHSNYLFTLNFMDGPTQTEIHARHVEFGRRHTAHLSAQWTPHRNQRDPARRLRIAYVSPDFRAHACAFFVEPLLRDHRRTEVEVYAYAEVAHPDAVTRRLQTLCEHWRSTVGLSDEQVAALIRQDEIDLVIDLAGHTANSRLLALARQPAPVQATYLGYPATTGIAAMQYRITDHVTEPVGQSEAFYTETLVRLPHSLWCYQPFADMPAVSALPAIARKSVTFGSFNSYAKIGPRVIEWWAAVLRAMPTARLVMITVPNGAAQTELRARFAALDVDPARLELHDRLLRAQYLALFSEVDIALDPFPCNGGTTTCDALWMGLPVVTWQGNTFLSRASMSILHAVGNPQWAAVDAEDYVARCVGLACDIDGLRVARESLRAQVAGSPLLDAPGFVRGLEALYRDLWRRWCESA